MGPRLGSRGKVTLAGMQADFLASFNGAATWKSRKAALQVDFPGFNFASMGPRLGSRGKKHLRRLIARSTLSFNGAATWKSRKVHETNDASILALLQWGRDLEVAER